ncbi:TetR/AcrR family transcriptional regulator [Terriglobus roseus]|uniref:Transcriptional regulator, TetR family n=1 Tax=Terriglobus roseus TaxID=392734 RepID=A0A1H4SDD2_9BACT|nr:TetR/AcrR family transcriptional regulator [Terriglobus roseus]SEC42040.1 transcriptional regulator, TetR family [Terriglobus roseus]
MPRPRSDDKRNRILGAAIRVIVTEGLRAPTMGIAREAGIANGSLFTYFETKSELFNELYLELKQEMASVAMRDFPKDAELRAQFFHIWRNWGEWALRFPEKRKALAQLSVSDEITPETRATGHTTMAAIGELLQRVRSAGSMRKVPMGFVVALMNSVADATMDQMIQDPGHAKAHCNNGVEALWRMVS